MHSIHRKMVLHSLTAITASRSGLDWGIPDVRDGLSIVASYPLRHLRRDDMTRLDVVLFVVGVVGGGG